MEDQNLEKLFTAAIDRAMHIEQSSLPQDVQLRLYAYYKQATFGTAVYNKSENFDLRNAFKTNAWMQISHLSRSEAKEKYIEIINSLTTNKKS